MDDIELRPFRPDDARAFHEAATESVAQLEPWMPWCHPGYTLAEAASWVSLQSKAFADQHEFEFVMVDRADRILGACGLNQIDQRNRRANVGYWVRTSVSGRGMATRAVARLLQWGAANTDLQRFEIVVAIDNTASIRVAEKVGAAREGVLRHRLLLHDRFHDAVIFSVVRA